MSKKAKQLRIPATITYKSIDVCFSKRQVTINGYTYTVDADCFSFPILSGDVVLIPTRGWERAL